MGQAVMVVIVGELPRSFAVLCGVNHVRAQVERRYKLLAFLFLMMIGTGGYAQNPPLGADVFLSSGYVLMARLDRKCPEPDSERAAAVNRYRTHYLDGVEQLVKYMKPIVPDALEKLRQHAANGVTSESTEIADVFLERLDPKRIVEICARAAKGIERTIADETRLREAFHTQQESVELK